MDQASLSHQVEHDLGPLFARVSPGQARHAYGSPPGEGKGPPAQRSLKPLFGGVVAAVLLGVALGSLLTPPEREPVGKPAVAQALDPAMRASPPREAEQPVVLASALSPPAPIAPTPQAAAAKPSSKVVAQRSVSSRPAVLRLATAPPAPRSEPISPPVERAIQATPAETPALRCSDSDEECLAYDVAEADRLLAAAYHEAWRLRVPNSRLKAVQRTWRPGSGYASDRTNRALLDAYEVRLNDIWGVVDSWEREAQGR